MPAPKNNDFATGNPGGGAPPANQNAATHQLTATPSKVLQWLEREQNESYEWVLGKYYSYLADAPFEHGSAEAETLKEVCVCEYIIWQNRGVQVMDGIIIKTHQRDTDGEMYEVEDERPENTAINRMDRQVVKKLETLDIYDE